MSDIQLFNLEKGSLPLLVSVPHCGTFVPEPIRSRLTPAAQQQPDADWHLERLYAFVTRMGGSLLTATHSRYVIDLNRPPDDASLYPGQTTTGLCPGETFRGDPVYKADGDVDAAEKSERRRIYWEPYHNALQDELARLKQRHGHVLLWEAHSIASLLPRLFDGRLPDLNFGTLEGKTCSPAIRAVIEEAVKDYGYSWVFNGRFKGGYITRHYGAPDTGVHAVQLEMSQAVYMDESYPFAYEDELAAKVERVLSDLLERSLGAISRL
ncbi:N-formylglutamate deformylase [Aromatoleum toluvorans]|uniref:N-formylglutamate deformylase n=1 Tax=Aromatoleum toluvorans TaxID=92002 RepID=A0ABX1Q4F0_9RHOO|nr:N-formylglutamate deformylase [Aromatoleum toluvorans]NMG46238.1 N-formylglutamate deformylase [Aromatoleum toluvorans]